VADWACRLWFSTCHEVQGDLGTCLVVELVAEGSQCNSVTPVTLSVR
jgi:hypothetical protein